MCPSKDIDSVPEDVKAQLGEQRDVLAARYPPSTRAEFEGWGRHWPINYRPRHEETEGDFVSPEDCVIFNENYESLLLENSAMLSLTGQENIGAVIVNPANKKVFSGCGVIFSVTVSVLNVISYIFRLWRLRVAGSN